MVIAGSLLGDAIAASTVIGLLTITTLVSVGLSGEKISVIIVMGSVLGSLMPPISQACALASALAEANPDEVIKYCYLTVSVIIFFTCLYVCKVLIKKNELQIKSHHEINSHPSDILRKNIKVFIPLIMLVIIVILRTISNENLRIDLVPSLLNIIKIQGVGLIEHLSQITILKGVANSIVLSIVFVTVISFLFKNVRYHTKDIIKKGIYDVKTTLLLQICAGFMLGAFYSAGQIEIVQEFALTLSTNIIKIGGSLTMALMGMLTGSQTTVQNAIFSSFAPILTNLGLDPTNVAVAGAHLAIAGQGLPPADLTTFCVVGIVGGITNTKINPVKVMIMAIPMCVMIFVVGLAFLYI